MSHDPFTISVIQAGMHAAADEMFAVLKKTAMSPIIYEVLDVGTGVTDPEGNLVSSGAGIPTFIGVLDKSVKAIVARHRDCIREGDVFVTNDPNYGGVTHLNDVIIAKPVFFEGQCVAWTASIAHWGDVGGMAPGSMATDATEIVAEGLRLPAIHLFEQGRAVSSVFDIIRVNSRLPEFVDGDLWAQLAASRSAEAKLCALFHTHGRDALEAAIEDSFATGRARARDGLRTLPRGRYEIEEEQDDGAVWRAAIIIDDDTFTVDLRGNPAERAAPYNSSRDGAVIACQMMFKALCDPNLFANAGSFEPLRVITEKGTIFDPGPRAPHGYYFELRIRLFDLLWQCMARVMPDRLPAGSFASVFGVVITGKHPDTGRGFAMVEPQMGGWGATPERDGMSAMFSTNHGNTYNCPVEICEARYGLNVVHKSLAERPRADAPHRGGHGVSLQFEVRTDAVLSTGYTRAKVPVWSRDGLESGGRNALHVVRASGETEFHRFVSGLELQRGDAVRVQTAHGGNNR